MDKKRHEVRVGSAGGGGGDHPADDGYSWRKYGQKEILGAKHPRCPLDTCCAIRRFFSPLLHLFHTPQPNLICTCSYRNFASGIEIILPLLSLSSFHGGAAASIVLVEMSVQPLFACLVLQLFGWPPLFVRCRGRTGIHHIVRILLWMHKKILSSPSPPPPPPPLFSPNKQDAGAHKQNLMGLPDLPART
jgi:hypothetical protein